MMLPHSSICDRNQSLVGQIGTLGQNWRGRCTQQLNAATTELGCVRALVLRPDEV